MKYERVKNGFAVTEYEYFDPAQTFDCGQSFRFEREEDGAWCGVMQGIYLRVSKGEDGALLIECRDEALFTEKILPFLALADDYAAIRADIARHFPGDATMAAAMELGSGIRILRQDPWEALCSFIISQNNNIPRIKKIINTLCRRYGEPVGDGRYAFPTAKALYDAGTDALYEARMGFRAKYVYDAAEKVCSGELDLEGLRALPTPEASAALQRVKGVGEKVAACTLLFGLGKTDAFPVDVWMKRIIRDYYNGDLDVGALGDYAGIAQQYLFYYIRDISL